MPIDWNKPVRFKKRPDRKAEVVLTNAPSAHPILLLSQIGTRWIVELYSTDDPRFENVPEPEPELIVTWQNVYDYGGGSWCPSLTEANFKAKREFNTNKAIRIGLIKRTQRDRADKGVLELVPEEEWNDE